MDRQFIIDEIKRTAAENGGAPLGKAAFRACTGIKPSDWYGVYWARWGDALREAGFQPNEMRGAYPEDEILSKVAALIRELGQFPVAGELRLKARFDKTFPSQNTVGKFGSMSALAKKVAEYCVRLGGFDDVVAVCESRAKAEKRSAHAGPKAKDVAGYVYMLRSGRSYKIGKTNAAGRRERELAIQLPEKPNTVHVIATDDPAGIEAYWHKRFGSKRKNGEWFDLSPADVAAFKRRRFM